MSSTGPDSGRYWPISSRNRWRRMPKRTQQYARTTGSRYAPTIRRMTSARIHDVPGAPRYDPIGRKPATQLLEPLDPLVAAGRPAALEQHHDGGRLGVELRDEVGAKLLDDRCLDVVVEVEIVEEARRLDGVEPQQRVDARLGRVQHLHDVSPADPALEVRHQRAHATLLRPDPRRVRRLDAFEPQQHGRDRDAREERKRHAAAQIGRAHVITPVTS